MNLDDLPNYFPHIDPVQCAYYAQNAIHALKNQGHEREATLIVDGDHAEQFMLTWAASPKKNAWKEGHDSTEAGALAIAFLLVTSLTEYTIVEQSPIGTGFDYWLGYPENDPRFDPDNFFRARLEVAGLAKGSPTEIAERVRGKLKQTDKSDNSSLPAYISVTAFGKPISYLRKK